MTEALWLIAAVISTLVGMGWLALAYDTHWQQVFPKHTVQPLVQRLRVAGWTLLLVSAGCCLMADHPSMAVLVWIMLLAVAAMTIAMVLSRQPVLLRVISVPIFTAEK